MGIKRANTDFSCKQTQAKTGLSPPKQNVYTQQWSADLSGQNLNHGNGVLVYKINHPF